MQVRTRFAPSPTGLIHLGNIRTAFFCWLYARHAGGKFVLRIEDTDQERSKPEWTKVIIESLKWLGLDCDEGPFFQSESLPKYRAIAEGMIQKGLAYRCYCSKERLDEIRAKQLEQKEKPRYDGFCAGKDLPHRNEPYVIRFRTPKEGEVIFDDLVAGHLTFANSELDDLVIIRNDGFPTYNFSVVVDDAEMSITHVIRGADHINNTPRQINIFKALGKAVPTYVHLPLILGSDGKLMSKRHGAKSLLEYRDDGYLKEALLNYLVRLGWSNGDQEIFSLEEMIKLFDVRHINKAPAAFNPEKLLWLNRHYIKTLSPKELAPLFSKELTELGIKHEGAALDEIITLQAARADTLRDMAQKSRYFFEEFASYEEKAGVELKTPESQKILAALQEKLQALAVWQKELLHGAIAEVAAAFDLKLGKVAQPLRIALTGGTVSPPIDMTMQLLGKERTLLRVSKAL